MKELEIHRYTLGLHIEPWKELQPCNVVLGPRGWHGLPDSGEAGGGTGREGVGAGSRSCWGPVWVLPRGGEVTGGRHGGGRRRRLLEV
jgi:hypothetical protein